MLLGQLTVNDERTLTLAPGTIIKGDTLGMFYVFGNLNAYGVEGDSIVFTSIHDDNYGGDTNGDADAESAAPGDWYGIYLNGNSGFNGVGHFDYCRVEYGGNLAGSGVEVQFLDASTTKRPFELAREGTDED